MSHKDIGQLTSNIISLLENCVFLPTNDVTMLQDHKLANDDIHFPVTELDTVIIRDMSSALLLMAT